jgi:hypothetical protein
MCKGHDLGCIAKVRCELRVKVGAVGLSAEVRERGYAPACPVPENSSVKRVDRGGTLIYNRSFSTHTFTIIPG